MGSVSTINCTRQTENTIEESQKTPCVTSAKIKQWALCFFGLLAAVGACMCPLLFLTAPLALFAVALPSIAYQIKDYENPEKLAIYRKEAAGLSFSRLLETFGLNSLLKYQVLPLEKVKEKFNREIQEQDFMSVLTRYHLEELLAHQVMSQSHLALLFKLKGEAEEARVRHNGSVKALTLHAPVENKKLTQERIAFQNAMNGLEERYNRFKQSLIN